MRLRTISQAMDIVRQEDPETAITESMLRRMIKDGTFPAVKVGNKALIDYDFMISWLQEQSNTISGPVS